MTVVRGGKSAAVNLPISVMNVNGVAHPGEVPGIAERLPVQSPEDKRSNLSRKFSIRDRAEILRKLRGECFRP